MIEINSECAWLPAEFRSSDWVGKGMAWGINIVSDSVRMGVGVISCTSSFQGKIKQGCIYCLISQVVLLQLWSVSL